MFLSALILVWFYHMVVVSMLAFVEFRSVSHALPLYSQEPMLVPVLKAEALTRGEGRCNLEVDLHDFSSL